MSYPGLQNDPPLEHEKCPTPGTKSAHKVDTPSRPREEDGREADEAAAVKNETESLWTRIREVAINDTANESERRQAGRILRGMYPVTCTETVLHVSQHPDREITDPEKMEELLTSIAAQMGYCGRIHLMTSGEFCKLLRVEAPLTPETYNQALLRYDAAQRRVAGPGHRRTA